MKGVAAALPLLMADPEQRKAVIAFLKLRSEAPRQGRRQAAQSG